MRRLTDASVAAAAHGLELGFHNHDAEVRPRDGGASFLDELLATDALFLELDLGWAWYAGADPLSLVGRARGRCPLVHVKDFYSREPGSFAPVGDGAVGYERVAPAAVAAGVEWLLVEQDETEGPALEAVRRSLEALRAMVAGVRGVRSPVRVGVVGCGVISRHYAENAKAFDSFELVACADLDESQARALAEAHQLEVASVDELIADPSVDVVLNLTPPGAHADVIRACLAAGKHVYTEKPLATSVPDATALLAEAGRLGLRIGCAPDTFLGSAYQAARALLDEGAIGQPLSVSAAVLVGAQESWHPNPDIFFADGAGPLLDMGPYYLTAIVALLGPVARVAGFASTRTPERAIEIGPRAGERFTVATPSHTTAAMELESGVTANLVASFETNGHYVCDLEIHGTEGVISLPDPNGFDGPVRMRRKREGWQDVPFATRGDRDARGIGLHDLVEAIAADRPERASGRPRPPRRRRRPRHPQRSCGTPDRGDRLERRPAGGDARRDGGVARASSGGSASG